MEQCKSKNKEKIADKCFSQSEKFCGRWSDLPQLQMAREKFGSTSAPDQSAGSPTQVDPDPRVYVMGGNDRHGNPLSSCEKYNPNTNIWSFVTSLPEPVGNCNASFVPDYGLTATINLAYIYLVGDNIPTLFRYNVKKDKWDKFPLPFKVKNAGLQYLDDIGGPLSEILQSITDTPFSPCSDGKTLWVVGGDDTERQSYYININVDGTTQGNWIQGPELPLKRSKPLIGRTFWRDAGITLYGVSNCATIIVAGGFDDRGCVSKRVQLLVRVDCNWRFITINDNPTCFPNEGLVLATSVAEGAVGTEQWPETGITGGRPVLFGGSPSFDGNNGSVQFAQLRFINGKYRRYPDNCSNDKTLWEITTSMPFNRINFKAAPLNQDNPSIFGGNRVSRFICVGGREVATGKVTDRVQLFQLPTPPAFVKICNK